jgi:hypothetical protein
MDTCGGGSIPTTRENFILSSSERQREGYPSYVSYSALVHYFLMEGTLLVSFGVDACFRVDHRVTFSPRYCFRF